MKRIFFCVCGRLKPVHRPESVLMARLNFDPAHSKAFLEMRVDSMGGMTYTVREQERHAARFVWCFARSAQLPGGKI